MKAVIDTSIFLRIMAEEPGWELCTHLLEQIYTRRIHGFISAVQLTELYTPFKRAGDEEALTRLRAELAKLRLKVVPVDRRIAEQAAELRARIRTPEGRWLPLADALILATALQIEAETLYTLDLDFYLVREVKVLAPDLPLDTWVQRYGTPSQRELVRKPWRN